MNRYIRYRFREDNEIKYLEPAKELLNQERSTIEVSFDDVEKYNQNLATTCIEEYYRIYPYLCQAVSNFVKDRCELKKDKECYVSFVDVPTRHKVRELKTEKIGTLIRISGQTIRTHPVHPELISGNINLLVNVKSTNFNFCRYFCVFGLSNCNQKR